MHLNILQNHIVKLLMKRGVGINQETQQVFVGNEILLITSLIVFVKYSQIVAPNRLLKFSPILLKEVEASWCDGMDGVGTNPSVLFLPSFPICSPQILFEHELTNCEFLQVRKCT